MIFYHKIVFGLKHHHRIFDCRQFIKLIQTLRIIISEHDAFTDDCERPGLHYHGIIEYESDTNVDNNNAFVQLKTYCSYFKIEKCHSPQQFIVELIKPPKKVMILEIAKSSNLHAYYSQITSFDMILPQYDQDFFKIRTMEMITNYILKRKIFDPEELLQFIQESVSNWSRDELKNIVNDSINLVRQKMLYESVLELCDFSGRSGNYYTLEESIDLILDWCKCQNIDVKTFTMDWVNCLDRQVFHKNALYFEGPPESGIKSIICAIAQVCTLVGEIYNECTGYTYVWEDCVDKRCILMRDPVFDDCMFEKLEAILKGIPTMVPHRKKGLEHLRPTPVILSCSQNDTERNSYLKHLRKYFLNSYVNLKPFARLYEDPRLLHPDWLYVLYYHFTSSQIDHALTTAEEYTDIQSSSED